jgi:hypothetical protein
MLAAMLLLLWSPLALAGVTVDEDEVIFRIRMPEAKSVFLVGDFNNWNPTVEKMTREGDDFVTGLFLVAGEYRYKFVVDGEWIVDPDNPPLDPKKGSPLFLEEKNTGLAMKTTFAEQERARKAVHYSVRYIGQAKRVEDDNDTRQQVDFGFAVDNKIVKSSVILKSWDDTWTISPLNAEIVFNRGYLELAFLKGTLTGFMNDKIWSSGDPLDLMGNIGVYGYNMGYGRMGGSLEQTFSKLAFRAVYCDSTSRVPWRSQAISREDLAAFVASGRQDTTLYQSQLSYAEEDVLGLELVLDLKNLVIGYANRKDRGMHPGILAAIEPEGMLYRSVTENTREYWWSHVLWVRTKIYGPLSGSFASGTGDAYVRRLSKSIRTSDLTQDLTLGRHSQVTNEKIPFQESHRWMGEIQYKEPDFSLTFSYEQNTTDFSEPLYPASSAKIHSAGLGVNWIFRGWTIDGNIHYVEQDYGMTPSMFHASTPRMNYWLDNRDRFTVENMVGFDLDRFTSVTISCGKNRPKGFSLRHAGDRKTPSLGVDAGGVIAGSLDDLEYMFTRVWYEHVLDRGFFFQGDARLASYRKDSWNASDTFISTYLEIGFRNEFMELSAGWGFDPIVFDPVRNDYYDIGRLEQLRVAVDPVQERGESLELGQRLMERERVLEDNTVLKIEWILIF